MEPVRIRILIGLTYSDRLRFGVEALCLSCLAFVASDYKPPFLSFLIQLRLLDSSTSALKFLRLAIDEPVYVQTLRILRLFHDFFN